MEYDFFLFAAAGAAVGLIVGITGVGGGSLMTPLLLLFGFPAHIAIGTDLFYAAITKAGGIVAHQRKRTIDWHIVGFMAAGSLPASAATVFILAKYFDSAEQYHTLLTSSLGIMLILTSVVIFFKKQLARWAQSGATGHSSEPSRATADVSTMASQVSPQSRPYMATLITGILLGVLVTLSSVGAGAFGAAALLILYPTIASMRIIGTDVAHAVPLTLAAGLGHLYLGNVDFLLLGGLLIGSIPAIYVGISLASRIPDSILHPILSITLLGLGIKYAFFN